MSKLLNELMATKVMGWKLANSPLETWANPSGNGEGRFVHEWNPSTCLDDALLCLERAAQGKGYSIYMFPEEKKPYDVELEVYKVCTDAETLPLAMCICALRGSGVSESDIQEALKS